MANSLGKLVRTLPTFSKILLAAGIAFLLIGGGISVVVLESDKVVVPDLIGASVVEAEQIASADDLSVDPNDSLPTQRLREFTAVTSQDPAPGERLSPGESIRFDYELIDVKVPRLVGRTFDAAQSRLENAGLSVLGSGARIVFSDSATDVAGIPRQVDLGALDGALSKLGLHNANLDGGVFELDPKADHGEWFVESVSSSAGTTLRAGSVVEVTLAVPLAQVPDVTGKTAAEATALARDAGLGWERLNPVFDGTLPADFTLNILNLQYDYWDEDEAELLKRKLDPDAWTVSSQSLAAGTLALRWEAFQLQTVWPSAIVPDLAGMSGMEARTALHDAGLSWRDVAASTDKIVESQSVPAGEEVPVGSRIGVDVGHEIIFSVTGNTGSGIITFTAPGETSIRVENPATVPWQRAWYPASAPAAGSGGKLTVQSIGADGWIACEISVDGTVVELKKSAGVAASVRCGY